MNKLQLISVAVLLMLGCSILPKDYIQIDHNFQIGNNSKVCKSLYDDIAKKWGHHGEFKSCYYYNEKLITTITQNKDCFVGLNENEVERLFGEQSRIRKNKISYTMSRECSEIDILFASMTLKFWMLDDKVRDVELSEADVHY